MLAALLLTGCLDNHRGLTCEQQVCSYALTTGDWDWRSESACLDTFACGQDHDACLDAVLELPCLSDPPTDAELLAHTRAMKAVREARCAPMGILAPSGPTTTIEP